MLRRFEFEEGRSRKFWEIALTGESFSVRFGKIGTTGQTQTKSFPSAEAARAEHEKLVREKLKKGYKEVGAPPAAAQAASPQPAPAEAAAPASRPESAPTAPSSRPEPAPASFTPAPPASPAAAPVAQEADVPHVRWTQEARREVHPWRGAPLAPLPPEERARLWPQLALQYRPYLGAWERGLARASEPCARLMRAVAANLAKRQAATALSGPLDAEEEAALASLLGIAKPVYHYWGQEARVSLSMADLLVDSWARAESLAFAVRALTRSGAFTAERQLPPSGFADQAHYLLGLQVWLQEAPAWECSLPALLALRRAVASADEASYAAARDEAERLRGEPWVAPPAAAVEKTAPLMRRCALAYAFPNETAWACVDAEEWLGLDRWWATEGYVLLATSLDRDTMERVVRKAAKNRGHKASLPFLPTLIDHLGADAASPLAWLLETTEGSRDLRRAFAETLSLIESPLAAAALAHCLTDKDTRAIASGYFAGVPRLALRTLLPAAGKQGEEAEAAASMAMSILGSHPEAAEAVRSPLSAASREALDKLLARIAAPAVETAATDLPPVLASPPWLDKKPRKPGTVIEGLAQLDRPERILWRTGEKERHTAPRYGIAPPKPETDPTILARIQERQRKGEPIFDNILEELTEEAALRLWNDSPVTVWQWRWRVAEALLRLLGRFDTRAIPGLIRFAETDLARCAEAFSRIDSPRIAPLVAQAFVRLKSARGVAQEWLLEHAETAAVGLVPVAVGPHGAARDAAGVALRLLASVEPHVETVRAVAARYGKETEAAVEGVLGFDPLLLYPAKLPRMPEFWNPAALPRPVLAQTGKPLPLSAVEHLGTMLAFSPVDPPYAGIARVKAACEPRSLAEFAWALFQQWLLAGAPSKEKWAFLALGHLGNDDTARRLTGLLREWSSEAYSRAVMGLDVLALFGTDTALRLLFGLAEKAKRGLRKGAEEKVQEVATRRGLTPEDLADRLVPDLDLERDGSMLLDFGPRSFRVGFDEQLRPYVKDAAGKRLRELPEPGAADDRAKAEAAAEAWKSLKKETRKLASEQVRRLELAMCARRRWDAEDFRTLLVEHPLLVHLARRIVWATFDAADRLGETFRICEDGTFADGEDRPFALPEEARVGIPHMLELEPERAQAWGRLLGDYEVLQPFVQIGREVHRLPESERTSDALTLVDGLKVPLGRVLGLERRGWRRGPPESHGAAIAFEKPLTGGEILARLGMSPGIGGAAGMPEEQTMHWATLHAADMEYAPRTPLGVLDPVVYSELVADLLSLKG